MKMIKNGVYPTMITPFTDDNKIVFTNIKTGMKAELPLSY